MLQGHKCQSKILAAQQFGIRVFRVPLEKSCKYIFTVNIRFIIVDTGDSEKHSFVGMCVRMCVGVGGGMVDPSGPRPIMHISGLPYPMPHTQGSVCPGTECHFRAAQLGKRK